ncbi:MAG: OmpA family protein [Myxococcota bacterium]
MINRRWIPIVLTALLAFSAGCASTPDATPAVDASETVQTVDSEFTDASDIASMAEANAADENAVTPLVGIEPIYFDLDRFEIRSEYESILRAGADALKQSGASIVIEGHCDERGSDDYNVALGEKRAGAVRDYLYNLGAQMNQMSIISYGEARPAVSGSGETAWRMNRRVAFQVR